MIDREPVTIEVIREGDGLSVRSWSAPRGTGSRRAQKCRGSQISPGGRLYLLSGGRERAGWVRNLRANLQVTAELGDEIRVGTARIRAAGIPADQRARQLLATRYGETENNLDEWERSSIAVVIELVPPPGLEPGRTV